MDDINQKTTEIAKPPMEKWREDLLNAKAAGADDDSAAQYAGLTTEQFQQRLHDDPTLEIDMLRAHADALLKHLNWIEKASQWQAHEFALMRFWPGKFSEVKGEPRDPRFQQMNLVVQTMSPDQLRRMPELLAAGIAEDKARSERERDANQNFKCLTSEPPSQTL